jgi:hypothetical protein
MAACSSLLRTFSLEEHFGITFVEASPIASAKNLRTEVDSKKSHAALNSTEQQATLVS